MRRLPHGKVSNGTGADQVRIVSAEHVRRNSRQFQRRQLPEMPRRPVCCPRGKYCRRGLDVVLLLTDWRGEYREPLVSGMLSSMLACPAGWSSRRKRHRTLCSDCENISRDSFVEWPRLRLIFVFLRKTSWIGVLLYSALSLTPYYKLLYE